MAVSGALVFHKHILLFLKITNLENENSTLMAYKSEKERLERETADLQDQIKKLKLKLTESEAKASIINNVESTNNNTEANSELVQTLKDENESTLREVETDL